jgi:hypothetical protein
VQAESDGEDLRPPVTGIYTLDATSLADSCDPPRWSGHYDELAIWASSAKINLGFPDGADGPASRIDLKMLEGSKGLDFAARVSFDPSSCTAGTQHIDVSATVTGPGEIEATLDESWTDLAECAAGPSRDCTSKRVFEYRLIAPCPCGEFVIRASGDLDCWCD